MGRGGGGGGGWGGRKGREGESVRGEGRRWRTEVQETTGDETRGVRLGMKHSG